MCAETIIFGITVFLVANIFTRVKTNNDCAVIIEIKAKLKKLKIKQVFVFKKVHSKREPANVVW